MKKWINFLFFFILILIFIIYPLCYIHRFNLVQSESVYLPPSWKNFAGTDSLGRDYFLRCVQAGYFSLIISFLSVIGSHGLGFLVGVLGTFKFVKLNRWIPYLINIFDSLPSFLVVSVLTLFFQVALSEIAFFQVDLLLRSILSLVIGITVISWMPVARMVRLEVLLISEKDYVKTTTLLGGSFVDVALFHYLRVTIKLLLMSMIQKLPHIILIESFVSFIGVGVVPPYLTLGALIQEGWKTAYIYPHFFAVPCMTLALICIFFQFVMKMIQSYHSKEVY